ncbi:hypothetical protein [Microbacter margulisiae]|uniref:Uroporphyrinogen decarboxylase (URO-D) domain-containing protein n=1 Tax=Microbacter margulisiae TaxID=1350067 RepID=A0A7W5H2B9_9PORP|nr:hypothetical protein [Microbacter margulisiae]MBB3187262.1 hypothetical protein [Microbacter margulisiae]
MTKSEFIETILPVEIVYHPSWWHKNAGITFDEDFFFHPSKRVESEQTMEKLLYEKFGNYGMGKDHDILRPEVGAVHNAAGFMLSEMLGCKVKYSEDASPTVMPLNKDSLTIDQSDVMHSKVLKKFQDLCDALKKKHGYLSGDVNWGGVLNLALDVRGQEIFTDFFMQPDDVKSYFANLASVIELFVVDIQKKTGTSSISVNRMVGKFKKPVFLHSECTHTMIANDQYEEFLLPIDIEWSKRQRPFGIHYCGPDPHRYANLFKKIPHLDFLDVGWGGDVKLLREALPNTFLNIRLDPVSINSQSNDMIEQTIRKLVTDSKNPFLTGICCINMDDQVQDSKVETILKPVQQIREEYMASIN